MYQNNIYRQMRAGAMVAVAALAFGASVAGAQDIPGCQGALVSGSQKYASAAMKALQKCEEGRLKGKILTTCDVDTKTQDKITKAATKFADGVTKSCAMVTVADLGFDGLVNRCVGGARAGEYCVTAGQCWGECAGGTEPGKQCTTNGNCAGGGTCTNPAPGVCGTADICPAFLNDKLPGTSCAIPLTSPATVGDCLECAANSKIDSLLNTFYGSLNAPSTDKAVVKCQTDIGKRTAKFFDAVEKAVAKCEAAVIKAGSGTCPDAKTTESINKAATKLNEAIAKTCSTAATISAGLKPTQIWGEATRFGTCSSASTQTAPGLSGALACLAQNAAQCDVGLSLTDTACSTALCGNGQIDAGETCDDSNTTRDTGVGGDDICPSDCAVAACAVTGTQAVTVNLTVPAPVVSALVLVSYDDVKVNLPGLADSPSVLARVTSSTFSTAPRDTETAVRIGLEDPTVVGVGSGAAATVTFDKCSGASVTAADFSCTVVSAGDTAFAELAGATCTVSVP